MPCTQPWVFWAKSRITLLKGCVKEECLGVAGVRAASLSA